MKKLKLKTQDGVIIEAETRIAKYFGTVKGLLKHFDNLDDDQTIDLLEVNSTILIRILEWAKHHIEQPNNLEEFDEAMPRKLTDIITTWEREFLKVDIETLFLYLRAANFLEIDDLRDIIVRIIANMLIGKSADEIRRKFHEIEKNNLSVI